MRSVSSFKLGLFVMVGMVLGLAAMIWLGATQYFEDGRYFVSFFAESVQGLQMESVVKYKGVDVGRVKAIRVAPDYRLIEVVMEINFSGDLSRDMVAQLRSVGITGIAFIELDRQKPGDLDSSPEVTFAAEHPIIPSKPSEISQILSVVEKLARQASQIDLERIAGRVESILARLDSLAKDPRVERSLTRLDQTMEGAAASSKNLAQLSARADQALARMQELLEEIQAPRLAQDARQVLARAQSLLEEMKTALAGMNLPRLGGKAQQMLEGASVAGQDTLAEIERTVESLSRASMSLQRLLERLERNPSDVIFSQPPADGFLSE